MDAGSANVADVISFFFLFFALLLPLSVSSPSLPLGAHPLDEKLYNLEVIKCKDGSKSFSRDRVNDNFCDCLDGTDEPGTSACPAGKFYCRNVGSKPQFLVSSHVNDGICDCCDGSDEHEGVAICHNTCVMGGNVAYLSVGSSRSVKRQAPIDAKQTKFGINTKDTIYKITGLKVLLVLQLVVVILVVFYWRFHRGGRSRRRHPVR